jgi:hypothetical protein
MNIAADCIYLALLSLFPLMWTLGAFLFAFRGLGSEAFRGSRFSRYYRPVFFVSTAISWLLMVELFITLPSFDWVNAILVPPLLLVSAISLWQLINWKGKASMNAKKKTIAFWIFSICFLLFMLVQFLYRFSSVSPIRS